MIFGVKIVRANCLRVEHIRREEKFHPRPAQRDGSVLRVGKKKGIATKKEEKKGKQGRGK